MLFWKDFGKECCQDEQDLSFQEKRTVPCLLGWDGGMKVEAWAKAWGGGLGGSKGSIWKMEGAINLP